TPLHCAIIDLKLEFFKLLLSHGADFTKQDNSGLTPKAVAENMELDEYVEEMEEEKKREQIFDSVLKAFADACKAEDVSRMTDILKCNSSPTIHVKLVSNAVTDDGLTPLCWACKCGNISMLRLLLQHEASIISCTSQDMAPIHLACHFEHTDCVQLLLQHCPDIVQRKMANDSLALHVAVETESLSLVTLLLNYDYPEYALEDFKEEGLGIGYKLPFDVNTKDSMGRSPLFLAAEKNNPDIVRFLLNFHVPFEKKQRRYEGRSRLTSDVSFEPELRREQFGSSLNSSSFSSNVYHPVDINLQGRNGFTPLHVAVSNSYYEVTDILLKHKADVNILANDSGKLISTLMMACRRGDSIILDKLFKYGADDLDKQVFTYAVEKRPKMVFTLLKYRTCKDVENEYKINRMDMRSLYRKMSEMEDTYDGLNSLNLDFKKKFPVHSVHVKWQDLQHIEMVKEEMLIDISCHHNPEIQTTSLNYPFALFAITKIDISGNKIGSVFPSVFFKLPSLHYLNLSKNQIKTFPDVTNMDDIFVCLEELLLDKNKIEVLPDYLFSVSTLRYLSVAHNNLREFSSELWDMQCLAYLNLSHNQIASLPQPRPKHSRPPSSGNLSSITSSYQEEQAPPTLVTPTKSSVEEIQVKHAVTWMSGKVVVMDGDFDSSSGLSNRGLQDLNLSKNRLSEIPFWLCCTSPYMENLNLSGNKIQYVGGLFQLPQYLKTLDLSGNNILDTVPWQCAEDKDGLCYNTRSARPTGSPHSFNSYTSFTQLLTCGHRQHRILERLDTLNLGFNRRLEKIVITRSTEDRQGRNSTASVSHEYYPCKSKVLQV
ncbi:leucine-rich repeat serine/threonine-protein kinase 1-like, partial [Saccostrea cucullata]|uniref:leucine-rich repeat serine/threonine-protein kinase 1-like n=1 Tax=Saccostrea cuccullata TaxID=36930 RepID=UPI002ED57DE2